MIRTITPIFSIIIAFVIFFTFTKPLFSEIRGYEAQEDQFKEAVAKASELNTELSRKVEVKRSYSPSDLQRLDALVPQEINEVRILADISEVAARHNMLFGNVVVANAETDPEAPDPEVIASDKVVYEELLKASIDFGVIGTYDQFKAFLADLEKSLVMLEVTGISFSAGEGTLQQYKVSVDAFALPALP